MVTLLRGSKKIDELISSKISFFAECEGDTNDCKEHLYYALFYTCYFISPSYMIVTWFVKQLETRLHYCSFQNNTLWAICKEIKKLKQISTQQQTWRLSKYSVFQKYFSDPAWGTHLGGRSKSQWVQDQPGLQSKLQNSQVYIMITQ